MVRPARHRVAPRARERRRGDDDGRRTSARQRGTLWSMKNFFRRTLPGALQRDASLEGDPPRAPQSIVSGWPSEKAGRGRGGTRLQYQDQGQGRDPGARAASVFICSEAVSEVSRCPPPTRCTWTAMPPLSSPGPPRSRCAGSASSPTRARRDELRTHAMRRGGGTRRAIASLPARQCDPQQSGRPLGGQTGRHPQLLPRHDGIPGASRERGLASRPAWR
jgi:hypothetical protein